MRAGWLLSLVVVASGCIYYGGDDIDQAFEDDVPDVVDGGVSSACSGLDLHDCRLTAGCVADTCPGCWCDEIYLGCHTSQQPPATCPALGCPRGLCCTGPADCDGTGLSCYPPGTDLGCGACMTGDGDCMGDGDCAAGDICQPIRCSCEGASACVPGCVFDTECGTGERCNNVDHRCEPAPCVAGCPDNFGCDAAGLCGRRSCVTDLDCDGYCVESLCYDEPGTCTAPPP